MVGVIGHIANPSVEDSVGLAREAEGAGASWIGLADAFWWRDVWMLLGAVAQATARIEIGPAMTNPYLRHRFHTAAALATLQEMAPNRVFCGVAAGGSEVSGAAGVSRSDAPARVRELVDFVRGVAVTGELDPSSGCELEVPLGDLPVLIAGRGDAMLRTAGAVADRALLWGIPLSDLDRAVALIGEGAAGRDRAPELVWAPLVRHRNSPESSIMHVAVYAALNTTAAVRSGWGLDTATAADLRDRLVAGDLGGAKRLVPAAALEDLVFDPPDEEAVAAAARRLGVTCLAVPGFSAETVASDVAWALRVEGMLG